MNKAFQQELVTAYGSLHRRHKVVVYVMCCKAFVGCGDRHTRSWWS